MIYFYKIIWSGVYNFLSSLGEVVQVEGSLKKLSGNGKRRETN